MEPTGSLQGKRIAITRAAERAEGFAAAIRACGAEVLVCPTIAYAPPDDPAPLDAALRDLDRYDWLMITSAAAVDALSARKVWPLPAHMRVAAVGKATAAAIEACGGCVDLLPAEQHAEGLLAELGEMAGARVLLPLADIARETLAAGLRARGAVVDVVIAYRTVPGPGVQRLLAPLRARALDAVVFSSPSTLRYMLDGCERLGIDRQTARDLLAGAALVAIGPATARALEEEGLVVSARAPVPTAEGMIAALVEALQRRLLH